MSQDGDGDELAQAIPSAEADRLQAIVSAYPGVTGVRQVLVSFIGPGRVWIVARIDIDDELRGAQVKSLVRGIESRLRRESEHIHRVDIVPVNGREAASGRFSFDQRSKGEPVRLERSAPYREPDA